MTWKVHANKMYSWESQGRLLTQEDQKELGDLEDWNSKIGNKYSH